MRWLLVVAVVLSCDRQEQVASPQRTEASEQVDRLRADNEQEFTDLRARWLATEGAVSGLRRDLETARKQHQEAEELHRAERVAAESLTLDLRLRLDALERAPRPVTRQASPVGDRVLQAYEELACAARRGAVESVHLVRERWGFESHEAWALAWLQVARDPEFEARAAQRIARLCP